MKKERKYGKISKVIYRRCELKISENYIGNYPYIKIEGVSGFDIAKIFDCGQSFRFEPILQSSHEKEFSGVAYGKFVSFAQDGDVLYIYGSDRRDLDNVWHDYLSLGVDYGEIEKDILASYNSEVLTAAAEYGRGIRILSQDPFETIISFIISQNNNIPRIKKIIETLCARCGKPIEICEEAKKHVHASSSLCAFPSAEEIVSLGVDGLYELKTGFRAKYIYDAATRVLDGKLDTVSIAALDTEDAIDALCEVKGIGLKVASCALLFGFGKYDAFPVDVWMKRVAQKYFPELENFSGQIFGRYAGIAQQYLFYYERWNNRSCLTNG